MQAEDRIRIQHMLDAGCEAIGFAANRTCADLDTDRILLLALVKCIEIIGEAASKVSDSTKAGAPGIPWRNIIDMRNRLIHGYQNMNLNIIWRTVTEEIPLLVPMLIRLIEG
jgi:uncharacterized protein with HEPN domain